MKQKEKKRGCKSRINEEKKNSSNCNRGQITNTATRHSKNETVMKIQFIFALEALSISFSPFDFVFSLI